MTTDLLPPLTGSALFDPWRIRYREQQGLPVERTPRRPTRSEAMLWEALRRSSHEWFAEYPTVHGYRLDFFCPAARLAVEVDGPSHWGLERMAHDARRDEVHLARGIVTRRFSARHVETDLDGVLALVEAAAARRLEEPTVVEPAAEPSAPELQEEWVEQLPEDLGWSSYLVACRTVLPASAARRSLLSRLLRS